MTLNLHDHFATSNSGVGNTRHMLRQNKLLRSHGAGNFLDLVTRLTHDPAMLLWLNGADSNRWAPNENYARELMELFSLGQFSPDGSPNYTEQDVREAARAFTGSPARRRRTSCTSLTSRSAFAPLSAFTAACMRLT